MSDRHRQVLDDLEVLIVDEGFSRVTVADMAARTRCSLRTLYEIAPNRAELILVVIDRRLRRLGRIVRAKLEQTDDPIERLRILLASESVEMRRASGQFREDVGRDPASQRLIRQHYRYAGALIREAIEDGMAVGVFRPTNARLVAEIVDEGLSRLQDPVLLHESGLTFDEGVLELAALVESGIVVRSSHDGQDRRPTSRTAAKPRGLG
jgi:AcrR family transcriptional regulator